MGGTSAARRRRRVVAAGVVAVALLAAACSGDDRESAGDADGDVAEPRYGGDARRTPSPRRPAADGACPRPSWSPRACRSRTRCTTRSPPPTRTAASCRSSRESVEPNDTFDTWTIRLRDGVTFHDGTAARPPRWSRTTWTPTGARTRTAARCCSASCSTTSTSVEVVDDLTVEVRTATPWVAFPWYLWNDGRMGIVAQAQLDDPETCDSRADRHRPLRRRRSGWSTSSFDPDPNEDYWQTDADGNQLPYLDRVVFRPVHRRLHARQHARGRRGRRDAHRDAGRHRDPRGPAGRHRPVDLRRGRRRLRSSC